ncbi:MAG: phage repressor protein [Proteobacteria bacterium]|nr:phage repressor protein [Pseudomonadota bacterium]
MEKTFRDALEHALEKTGKSLRSVAIEAGVSYDQLKSLRQGKSQKTNVDDAMKVARAFRVSLEDFYNGDLTAVTPSITVAGLVGAGARVDLSDPHAKGDGIYHIKCPSEMSPHGVVAVEVSGDSMAPIYQQGDVLIYSRDTLGVPSEAIGKICICEDAGGQAWVKVLRTGSEEGTFSLLSVNPEAENMHGVRLKWAAPVKMHVPNEFIQKTSQLE